MQEAARFGVDANFLALPFDSEPVERFYRDVRLFRLYEGTSQIQQLVIAKQIIRNAENAL